MKKELLDRIIYRLFESVNMERVNIATFTAVADCEQLKLINNE
jgi:hypothetical protein